MRRLILLGAASALLSVLVAPSAVAVAATARTGPALVPSIKISDGAVIEGNAGTTLVNLSVKLSAAAATAVTVRFNTADSTAVAGADYVATQGTLTIPAGARKAVLKVSVTGDALDEDDEAFSVRLSHPVGATIADGVGWRPSPTTIPCLLSRCSTGGRSTIRPASSTKERAAITSCRRSCACRR